MLRSLLLVAIMCSSQFAHAADWVPFGKEWKSAKFSLIKKKTKKLGIPIKYTKDGVTLGIGKVPGLPSVNYLEIEFDEDTLWKTSTYDFKSIDNSEDEYGRMYWITLDWVLDKVKKDYGKPTQEYRRINLISDEKYSTYEWDRGDYIIKLGLLDEFIQGRVRLQFIRKG